MRNQRKKMKKNANKNNTNRLTFRCECENPECSITREQGLLPTKPSQYQRVKFDCGREAILCAKLQHVHKAWEKHLRGEVDMTKPTTIMFGHANFAGTSGPGTSTLKTGKGFIESVARKVFNNGKVVIGKFDEKNTSARNFSVPKTVVVNHRTGETKQMPCNHETVKHGKWVKKKNPDYDRSDSSSEQFYWKFEKTTAFSIKKRHRSPDDKHPVIMDRDVLAILNGWLLLLGLAVDNAQVAPKNITSDGEGEDSPEVDDIEELLEDDKPLKGHDSSTKGQQATVDESPQEDPMDVDASPESDDDDDSPQSDDELPQNGDDPPDGDRMDVDEYPGESDDL